MALKTKWTKNWRQTLWSATKQSSLDIAR